jgi:hypothetical protein
MSVPIRRVSSLEDLKAFFGSEPRQVHPTGWQMGAVFVIQDQDDAHLEVLIAPGDVELKITALSNGSSEMDLRVTDASSWELVGEPGSQKLVVGGGRRWQLVGEPGSQRPVEIASRGGIREVTIGLRPTKIQVTLDW